MTDDTLRIARWRCHTKHRIPSELVDDFLHDAIVFALEHDPPLPEHVLANWLSLVAYRKYLTDKYRLATRKTQQMPVRVTDDGGEAEIPFESRAARPDQMIAERDEQEQLERNVAEWIESLPGLPKRTAHLLVRCDFNLNFVASAEGVTKQAIHDRLQRTLRRIK